MCDVDRELGQRRLQELEQKFGPGRVIFIETDVRSYQQFEGNKFYYGSKQWAFFIMCTKGDCYIRARVFLYAFVTLTGSFTFLNIED